MAGVMKGIIRILAAGLAIFSNIVVGSGLVEPTHCSENAKLPDLRRAYQTWMQKDLIDPSFQLIPNVFRQLESDRKEHANQFNNGSAQRTLLYGRRKCSSTFRPRDNSLMERSTCPWYVELNFDENRYPSTLATVKCRCSECYDLTKKPSKRDNNNKNNKTEISGSKCQEISYMQKVLKQKFGSGGTEQCTNDIFDYDETYEKISVGCTCTKEKGDIQGNEKTAPEI